MRHSRQSYDVSATTSASPDVVYDLLVRPPTWPTWSPLDELVVAETSPPGPDGREQVGSVRAWRVGKTFVSDRITELVPDRRVAYVDEVNTSLFDYAARVDLDRSPGGGTVIRWWGDYSVPLGRGLLMREYLRRFMGRMADGLATHATSLA